MPECRRPTCTAVLAGIAVLFLCAPGDAQAQRRCRVADVVVAPSNDEVQVGDSLPFTATGFDAVGSPCDNLVWIFTSSNTSMATISAYGIARGIAPGTVVITARIGSGATLKSNTATLRVVTAVDNQATSAAISTIPNFNPVPGRPTSPGYAAFDRQPEGTGVAEGLLVDPVTLVMVRGEARPIDFRAVRASGEPASRVPILFGVDPGGERIVQVDTLGIVTSLGDSGTATIRLTVPGQTRIPAKIVRVEVKGDPVRFDKTEFSMAPGAMDTLYVYVPTQTRSFANPSLFQFRSTDSSKVRVSPLAPIVTAISAGTARIVTQSPLYPEISATIHVHRVVDSLRLEPGDSLRIAISESTLVRAIAFGENGTLITEAPVTMRMTDTSVIAFDSATGVVRGKRAGLATILITVPTSGIRAITRSVRIRVIAPALRTARTRVGISVGDRYALDVNLVDDAGRPIGSANRYITWTGTPDTIVRVENHEIVPLRPGRVRLTGRTAWDSTVTVDVFVVGDIIVTAQVQGRRDLVTKWGNAGQNWMPLTSDSAVELQTAWSPDLTRIAFTARPAALPNQRNTATGAGLFLMNADASGRVRLTPDSTRIQFPSFLPSGDRIVYESSRFGPSQIWMMELRGDSAFRETQVTTATPAAANTQPAVTRDGQRLAYVSVREVAGRRGYGIYLAGIDGSQERLRFQAPRNVTLDQPVFSPDGQTLYFLRSEERPQGKRVYQLTANGAATDTAATAVTPPGMFVNSFAINADGSILALATQEPAQGNQPAMLHVMLFSRATGQAQSIDSTTDERPASPTMRPPTPRPAAATPNR